MKIIESKEQKENTEEKRTEDKAPVKHHRVDQHLHCGNFRKTEREKEIENI